MIKKCKICGAEFKVNQFNRVYCSKECAKIGQKQKQKEYREKNRDKYRKIQLQYYYNHREEVRAYKREYYQSHKKTKAKQIRLCKWCGKPFEVTSHNKIYCSEKCVEEHKLYYFRDYYNKYQKAQKTKTCQWCGKEFERTYGNEKYCSDECRKKARREQARKSMERRNKRPKYPCRHYLKASNIPLEICLTCKPDNCRFDNEECISD